MTLRPAILGFGTATPRCMVDQDLAARVAMRYSCETAAQERLLPTLYRRTGIRRRGSTLIEHSDGACIRQEFFPAWKGGDDRGPGTAARSARYAADAPPLACRACAAALCDSVCPASEITHLVTVSCTGFFAPGVDVAIVQQLGLAPTVERTHIGFMGCHGALNGLRVAAALAQAAPQGRVLLCAVELCSLHYRYGWDPDKVLANALFADGAAAAVIGAIPAPPGSDPTAGPQSPRSSDGRQPPSAASAPWFIRASGSCILPDTQREMTWAIGDHGFEMTLSSRVPDLIARHFQPWMRRWLAAQDLAISDIASWAIHPGGPRIVESVAASLALTPSQASISTEILSEFGNMSSPTLLFILQRLRSRQSPLPCVALGFGPGLTFEAVLLDHAR